MVKTFGVCDFSRLAVTDWRLRRVVFGAYDSYPKIETSDNLVERYDF